MKTGLSLITLGLLILVLSLTFIFFSNLTTNATLVYRVCIWLSGYGLIGVGLEIFINKCHGRGSEKWRTFLTTSGKIVMILGALVSFGLIVYTTLETPLITVQNQRIINFVAPSLTIFFCGLLITTFSRVRPSRKKL